MEKKFHKYKGRVVFGGNQVKDENGLAAVFSEQGSSSSHLTAASLLDALGHMPGMEVENAHATGAYTQSPMEGDLHVETWVIIEPEMMRRLVAIMLHGYKCDDQWPNSLKPWKVIQNQDGIGKDTVTAASSV